MKERMIKYKHNKKGIVKDENEFWIQKSINLTSNSNILFDFTQLPYYILDDIFSELGPNDCMKLLLLNKAIFNVYIPIIYKECRIKSMYKYDINFKAYGKFIKALSLSLFEFPIESRDKLIFDIQENLNNTCQLDLSINSLNKLEHVKALSKFKIKKLLFQIEMREMNSPIINIKDLYFLSTSQIYVTIPVYSFCSKLLKELPLSISKLKISCDQQIEFDFLEKYKNLTFLDFHNNDGINKIESLFQISYPNLEILKISYYKTRTYLKALKINGNNFPKLRELNLKISFNLNFINLFKSLEILMLRKQYNMKKLLINLPESRYLKSLLIDGFYNQDELFSIIKSPNDILETFHSSFLGLNFLKVHVQTLYINFFVSFLTLPKLKLLNISWRVSELGFQDWFKNNSKKKLLLQFLLLNYHPYLSFSSQDLLDKNLYNSFLEFLIVNSPNLIAVTGHNWAKDICSKLNIPFLKFDDNFCKYYQLPSSFI